MIHSAGTTETDDLFGFALAVADFDRDGFADAAFGHPGEFQLVPQDGGVTVIVGSASGLTAGRRHGLAAGYWGTPGVPDQTNRRYGFSLATGDFDGDGHADLAIGAPFEDEGGLADVGALAALYGALFADGFETQDFVFWSSTVP